MGAVGEEIEEEVWGEGVETGPSGRWTPAESRRATLAGAARSLGIVLATLAFGLAWAEAERLAAGPAAPGATAPGQPPSDTLRRMVPPDPPPAEPELQLEPELWLVDGFNVLHAGVLKGRDRQGWWTAPVQLRLVERVARFDPPTARLWVVFDAASPGSERCAPGPELARVELFFAPSADDWIVRQVRQAAVPRQLAVVSGDRQVAGRARHAGAQIVSPRAFLARCRALGEDAAPA